MKRLCATILLALLVGCQTGTGTPTTQPSANPLDGKWHADFDGDAVPDCATIAGGAITAQSTSCTTALLIIQSLAIVQTGQDVSIVWVTRHTVSGVSTDTQMNFEGTIQADGTITGTLHRLITVNGIPAPATDLPLTFTRVTTA
jgi:hypothetical protein